MLGKLEVGDVVRTPGGGVGIVREVELVTWERYKTVLVDEEQEIEGFSFPEGGLELMERTEIKLAPGDIVANPFGHVMVTQRIDQENGMWVCFYECSPSAYHWYKEDDLRLLSKTKGAEMSSWNSGAFAETIRKSKEWAGALGKAAPRKYKKDEQIGYKRPSPAESPMTAEEADAFLKQFSKEELRKLLLSVK